MEKEKKFKIGDMVRIKGTTENLTITRETYQHPSAKEFFLEDENYYDCRYPNGKVVCHAESILELVV